MAQPSNHNCCTIGLTWDYECRECGLSFQMPVPRGPSEEADRACPHCQSRHIERTNVYKSEAGQPGG